MTTNNPDLDPKNPENSKDSPKDLLKKYEPILRFSEGERFFPMRVEDYLKDCVFVTDTKERKNIRIEEPDEKEASNPEQKGTKIGGLGKTERKEVFAERVVGSRDHKYYLQYVYNIDGDLREVLSRYWQFIWFVISIIVFAIIEYILLPLDIHTTIASGIIIFLLLLWPYRQVNRRAYLVFLLNVGGVLFFGTDMAILAGATILITIALLAALHLLYEGRMLGTWHPGFLGFLLAIPLGFLFKYSPMLLDTLQLKTFLTSLGLKVEYPLIPSIMVEAGENMLVWQSATIFSGLIKLIIGTVIMMLIFGNSIKGKDIPYRNMLILFLVIALSLEWWVLIVGYLFYSFVHHFIKPSDEETHAKALDTREKKIYLRQQIVVLVGVIVLPTILFFRFGFFSTDLGRIVMGGATLIVASLSLAWFFIEDIDIMNSLNWKKIGLLTLAIGVWSLGNIWYQTIAQNQLLPLPLLPIVAIHLLNLTISIVLLGSTAIGAIMDMQSSQTDRAAHEAAIKYEVHSKKPYYYGRVWTYENWQVLQYHYFYAYNDYRISADGINHHEGDWEMVAVFLKNGEEEPYGVGYSQHHHGAFRFWENVEKLELQPVVYVALGSHANYPNANIYDSTQQLTGLVQFVTQRYGTLLREINRGIEKDIGRAIFLRKNDMTRNDWINYVFDLTSQQANRIKKTTHGVIQRNQKYLKKELNRFERIQYTKQRIRQTGSQETGLPYEYVDGEGPQIGSEKKSEDFRSILNVFRFYGKKKAEGLQFPEQTMHRIPRDSANTPSHSWTFRVLPRDDNDKGLSESDEITQFIISYKGLWGRKERNEDESGPTGPRWNRVDKVKHEQEERIRWVDPIGWKNLLLLDMVDNPDEKVAIRVKALNALIEHELTSDSATNMISQLGTS